MIAAGPADILRFASIELAAGRPCAFVSLTAVEGSSSRGVGAQMAVAADGRSIGSFSGGCIEAAVVTEAVRAIGDEQGRTIRFGVGSPYLDVRLPCGGGIDLLFTPVRDGTPIDGALALLEAREPAELRFSANGVASGAGSDGGAFGVRYVPGLRLIAIGQGEDLVALARAAHRFAIEVEALTPDKAAIEALQGEGIVARALAQRTELPDPGTDPWSAIVFLFHDRDWEEHLLPQALALPAFYHGAVGSPNTHKARLAHLQSLDLEASDIAKLRGCIGLIPSTRDPATLALSVLAEIVACYNDVRR